MKTIFKITLIVLASFMFGRYVLAAPLSNLLRSVVPETDNRYFVGTTTAKWRGALFGSATSTADNGWNITAGCFSINSTCVGGGAGTITGSGVNNTLVVWTGTTAIGATSSQPLTVGSINATTTATSTYAGGINATSGCFAINGTCVGGGGGGSGTINSGTINRYAYYSGATTLDSANYLTTDITNQRLGVATATPFASLSVAGISGQTVPVFAVSTSTASATSTAFIIDKDGLVGIGDETPASLLTVGNGDLFQINSSGLALHPLGLVGTPSISFVGDTNTGMWSSAADTLNFSTAGSERMRIDSTGRVGIGTAAPSATLGTIGTINFGNAKGSGQDINFYGGNSGSTRTYFRVRADLDSRLQFFNNGTDTLGGQWFTGTGGMEFSAMANRNMGFRTGVDNNNLTTHLTIGDTTNNVIQPSYFDNGNLGIGTSTPNNPLQILGNTSPQLLLTYGSGGANAKHFYASSTGSALALGTLNDSLSTYTELVRLNSTGFGIGTTSPGTMLSVAGDGVIAGATTFRQFNATSTTATSTIQGFLDVNGTGTNATSTIASNLWVKGTLRTGTNSVYFSDDGITVSGGTITQTTAATTSYTGGVSMATLNVTSTTATSTGSNGFNLTGGCFARNGTCVGGTGTVTSVDVGGGASGMSFTGGPITTSGTLTMSGTLAIANGGTNNTVFSSGSVIFYDGTRLQEDNTNFFWNNNDNRLGIASTTPGATLGVGGNTLVNGTTTTSGLLVLTNAGVGTSTPWRTFGVNGTGAWTGLTLESGSGDVLCVKANGEIVQDDTPAITCSGAASSEKIKHDITVLNPDKSLATILALRPISYIYNRDYSRDQTTHFGFTAEDVAKIEPRLLDLPTDKNAPKGLKYTEFISHIVSSIQKIWTILTLQTSKMNDLEIRVAKLEKENVELHKLIKIQLGGFNKVLGRLKK